MALNLHFLHHITYNILCPFLHFWFSIWSKQHFIYIMSSSLQLLFSLFSLFVSSFNRWVKGSLWPLSTRVYFWQHVHVYFHFKCISAFWTAFLSLWISIYLTLFSLSASLFSCCSVILCLSLISFSLFLSVFTTMYYWQILPQQLLPFIRLSKKLFAFSSVASFVLKCKHFADLIKKYYNSFCWWTQGSTAIFSSYTNISIWIFVNIIYFSETLSYIWCCHMKVSKMHSLQMYIYRSLPKWQITGFIIKVFD